MLYAHEKQEIREEERKKENQKEINKILEMLDRDLTDNDILIIKSTLVWLKHTIK
jgi:glutathione S-transferase